MTAGGLVDSHAQSASSTNRSNAKKPAVSKTVSSKSVSSESQTENRTDNKTETSSETLAASLSDDGPVGYSNGEMKSTMGNESSWRRSKETKFAYKIGSGFDSFANEREQAQFFGLTLRGDFKAQLMESLNARIKGGVDLTTGYAQSRFGDNVGSSGVYLQEAILNWRMVNSSLLRAYVDGGAVDQGVFRAPLFISEQAFPGVRETLVFGSSKEFKLRVWAQQTIPTSRTLSTRTVDAEVTPTFLSETVDLTIEPNDSLKMQAAVTHFAFNSLPSAVALESVIYGNSTDEIGPNTSRFRYRFDGVMARGDIDVSLGSSIKWTLEGYVIQNTAAPEGFRNAQHILTGFDVRVPGEINLRPTVSTFFIEDDAVPGFYNSSIAGHNNRSGFSAGLEAFFQKQRFKLKADYIDADVINFNINQSRQQTLKIGFETFYEIL